MIMLDVCFPFMRVELDPSVETNVEPHCCPVITTQCCRPKSLLSQLGSNREDSNPVAGLRWTMEENVVQVYFLFIYFY